MKKKSLLFSKKGSMSAKMGMDLGMTAIFVLAIGLSIVVSTYTELTTGPGGNATGAELTGISATVLNYAPLIVVAVFIYGVARLGGVI